MAASAPGSHRYLESLASAPKYRLMTPGDIGYGSPMPGGTPGGADLRARVIRA